MKIRQESIPPKIKQEVVKEKVEPKARKALVRAICQDIDKTSNIRELGRKEYKKIAMQICEEFPGLRDIVENNVIIGTGYQTVLDNIENTMDNLKRPYSAGESSAKKQKTTVVSNMKLSEDEETLQKNIATNLKEVYPAATVSTSILGDMKSCHAYQRMIINGKIKSFFLF